MISHFTEKITDSNGILQINFLFVKIKMLNLHQHFIS
jgi:hypothetical protein